MHAFPSQNLLEPRRTLISVHSVLRRTLANQDLRPLAQSLRERLQAEPRDAKLMMDLSLVLQVIGDDATARHMQAEALKLQRCYTALSSWTSDGPSLRVLALMMPGVLTDNIPLDCLLAYANVQLDVLYVNDDGTLPDTIPDHDVLFVAIRASSHNQNILQQCSHHAQVWPRPVLNQPENIRRLSPDNVPELLTGIAGLTMPPIRGTTRLELEGLVTGEFFVDRLVEHGRVPLIIRPRDSHAGHGLERVDDRAALGAYLLRTTGDAFHVSLYVDYRSADGRFRKYRVVLIQGVPYLCHVAISNHSMVQYVNAGMAESMTKRQEESWLMESFDHGCARRHAAALQGAYTALGLDYVVLDCAETPTGELLVFEADTALVVHDADPAEIFPYKKAHMRKLLKTFEAMLATTVETKRVS